MGEEACGGGWGGWGLGIQGWAQGSKNPKVHAGPRVQGSKGAIKGPRVQGSKGPCCKGPRSKGPGVQGYKFPKVQLRGQWAKAPRV